MCIFQIGRLKIKFTFQSCSNVINIDFKKIADTIPPVEILDPGDQYIADANPLSEEYYYYTIIKAKDDTLQVKLTRQVLKYQNGQPDKTINYWPNRDVNVDEKYLCTNSTFSAH